MGYVLTQVGGAAWGNYIGLDSVFSLVWPIAIRTKPSIMSVRTTNHTEESQHIQGYLCQLLVRLE